ncbi:hypothetical protein MVEN_02552800 [Mycena venus]|uniref:Uncharacterized protein n=1 Tax=Mycena venus TaxID=2733690 RepID=A0A8H6U3Y3_9AGAR|nr:hypothetical protein MVEN_02552800 [Mycena venus]
MILRRISNVLHFENRDCGQLEPQAFALSLLVVLHPAAQASRNIICYRGSVWMLALYFLIIEGRFLTRVSLVCHRKTRINARAVAPWATTACDAILDGPGTIIVLRPGRDREPQAPTHALWQDDMHHDVACNRTISSELMQPPIASLAIPDRPRRQRRADIRRQVLHRREWEREQWCEECT